MDKTPSDSRVAGITLGTAGHIDHGKSALIERLTGTNPDRLKEEQIRGMTIDLGYAFYVTRKGKEVGVIDVPGHERLVRNMVTGATGIDLVILAVAADDGVMPQTREHLDIMNVLGIGRGIVALTKIDLVDDEMIELATEDVKSLVAGTFLEGSPIIPVSSQTGQGLDRLIDCLEEEIEKVEHVSLSGLFRMPIQRVFSAKGFGTVVTGVPVSGSVRAQDPVEVLPQGFMGKVRGLQAFGRSFPEGRAGHRIALNISDVNYRAIHRGCTVAAPGYFEPCHFFEGHFAFFESCDFSLKNMTEVKVHAGTAEEMAKIVLLDTRNLGPGESGFVQVRLENPLIVAPGDRFLIRRHSPPLSMGGGMILHVSKGRTKRFKPYVLEPLEARRKGLEEGVERLIALEARSHGAGFFTVKEMARTVGQRVKEVEDRVRELAASGEILEVNGGRYLHRDRYAHLAASVVEALDALHRSAPLNPYADIKDLRRRIPFEDAVLHELLPLLEEEKRIETAKGGWIRRSGFRVTLDEAQRQLADRILEIVTRAGLSPPEMDALIEAAGAESDAVGAVAEHLVSTGGLVKIAGFYFATEWIDRLKETVRDCAREHGEVKIPLIRDTFSTSRKYLIPLMEYLDNIGLTRREGDRRFLEPP